MQKTQLIDLLSELGVLKYQKSEKNPAAQVQAQQKDFAKNTYKRFAENFSVIQKERIKKEVIFIESLWGLIAQSQPSTVEAEIALEFLKLIFNPYLE